MSPALGRWDPLPLHDAIELFRPAPFRWWISGGRALDLHLGRSWRAHADTDVSIRRVDVPLLREVLDGWDVYVAAAGDLTPWDGQALDAERSQNNLWCRPGSSGPWRLDVTIGSGDDLDWVYRRDPSVRRPWSSAVLRSESDVPYLAPELQLLFKSRTARPKDDADAAEVVPALDAAARTWLADHLAAGHPWQELISHRRAMLAVQAEPGPGAAVRLLEVGRSSTAWVTGSGGQAWSVRVPIVGSGRRASYRSEELISHLLADAGHPVSRLRTTSIDGLDCSIGPVLPGTPVDPTGDWPSGVVEPLAAVLRDLHALPVTGWGPLADRSDRLQGISDSMTTGIVDRWFHATVWPFDGSLLGSHSIARNAPELVGALTALRQDLVDAAGPPFGLVHSDLHPAHLLEDAGRLTGLLDFGDAFVGSTAWDLALLRWYGTASNASHVADAYGAAPDLVERAGLLAVAVGCYKVAKTPHRREQVDRLRTLLDEVAA